MTTKHDPATCPRCNPSAATNNSATGSPPLRRSRRERALVHVTAFAEARERMRLGWTVDPTTRRRAPFLVFELAAIRADRRSLERARRDFENAAAATHPPVSCQ